MITNLEPILTAYSEATGRAASIVHYEYAIGKFAAMGFTAEDMATVCKFLVRENKRRQFQFQYSLKLSPLLNDPEKFSDLLQEARARIRPAPTPAQKVLAQFRGVSETETITSPTMAKDAAKAALASLAKEL